MSAVLLVPDEWVHLPGTHIEALILRGRSFLLASNPDGTWDLSTVPGMVLARVVYRDGRRSWPWPVTPLPLRRPVPSDRATRRAPTSSTSWFESEQARRV